MSHFVKSSEIVICPMSESNIDVIVTDFANHKWPKPRMIFEQYVKEQEANKRLTWTAWYQGLLTGYVTLKWQSLYDSFQKNQIPEVIDLNVLPPYRNRGIGSVLLQRAEDCAFQKGNRVGLGVGLYQGYGAAQNMYISRGYRPDGLGITYHYKRVDYGEKVPLDDDLVLWFIKQVKSSTNTNNLS